MDDMTYRINECTVIAYLIEKSQKHVHMLYNGKIFNEMVVKKMVLSDTIGFAGIN